MSISGLLNQTLTHYTKSSYGADGRESFGAGTAIKARLQPKTKRLLLPDGSVLTIDAVAFILGSITVNTDDKLVHGTTTYKVVDIYPVPDDLGNTHHQELRLVKWQA